MKNIGLIMLFSLLCYTSFAQTEEKPAAAIAVEPTFVGGTEGMMNFLSENIKYPKEAIESNTSGRVYVSLVINEAGKVIEVEILRGVSNSLDLEAIRVCEKMPNWNPARDGDGNAVKSEVKLPIAFTLD
ncbi:MAG: energy transducer TonB [Crocinitomicaceae bacterium]